MIILRMIVPLTLAVFAIGTTGALGQTPFPAPLPNSATGTVNDPAFPPVNGAPAQKAAAPQDSAVSPRQRNLCDDGRAGCVSVRQAQLRWVVSERLLASRRVRPVAKIA